jgi:P-type E1-E2 ATPase
MFLGSCIVGTRESLSPIALELCIRLHWPLRVSRRMYAEVATRGKTAILAAVNRSVCVVMGIADELKPDAAASIKYLVDEMKMDVWMVTGGNARTARAISRKLGLAPNRVISEALPVAKVRQVKKLQREGKVVASTIHQPWLMPMLV